ncbi:MAG: hypothetical protein V1663_00190 [archaeon]
MKKMLFVFIILIFISGCASTNQFRNYDDESKGGYTDGVKINILSPTSTEIWEGSGFVVKVKLENYADCDVSGDLCVRDLLGDGFGGIQDNCQGFSIRKHDINVPYLSFQGDPYESIDRKITTTIQAEATYSCSISLDPLICIRDDSEETAKLCKDSETVSGKYPGLKTAPITITSVQKEFDPYTGTLRLDIYLDSMGGELVGDTINDNREEGFPINIEYGSYGGLDCNNVEDGIYYWKSNTENIINCETSISSVNDVEENFLKIDLTYRYRIRGSKPVTIRDRDDEFGGGN